VNVERATRAKERERGRRQRESELREGYQSERETERTTTKRDSERREGKDQMVPLLL